MTPEAPDLIRQRTEAEYRQGLPTCTQCNALAEHGTAADPRCSRHLDWRAPIVQTPERPFLLPVFVLEESEK